MTNVVIEDITDLQAPEDIAEPAFATPPGSVHSEDFHSASSAASDTTAEQREHSKSEAAEPSTEVTSSADDEEVNRLS